MVLHCILMKCQLVDLRILYRQKAQKAPQKTSGIATPEQRVRQAAALLDFLRIQIEIREEGCESSAMCDKAKQDPEATLLTSNPVSETDDRQSSYQESVDTLGSSPGTLDRTATPNAGPSCSSGSSLSPIAAGQKPHFYIEVDASSMVNLKAGTQYTLVPLDADQATAAGIPASGIAQTLAWGRTLDGRLPGEEAVGNPRVASKEELTSDAFGLDQGMMNTFDATAMVPGKSEEPDPPLDAEFESSEDKMTYTPLMTVSQPQQQPQQQTQPHEATATAAAQMQHAPTGYEAAALRYRPTTSPVYGGPPQHTLQHQTTTPYLVNPRGSWTPFAGTTTTQSTVPDSELVL
ncbi:uncharacterized protein LOC142793894 [Rhipicephalus microplus]|uniref:uncharacterized protein LOC142793894 n=1 Tax=Rhipicephalus microplus TaxID=6941 RepID=UPI003F6A60CD